MRQILTTTYVIAAAAFTIFAVANEMQPALFWISLFAHDIGDTYPLFLVGLLTLITLLMPLVIFLLVKRMLPEKVQSVDGPGIWIIRKRQLQSALVEIPIYINDQKIGGVAMGKIKFFPASIGQNTVKAGKGMSASDPMNVSCDNNDQVYLRLEIIQAGLIVKYVLQPISATDAILQGK